MRSTCRDLSTVLLAVLAMRCVGSVPIASAAGVPTYVGEWGTLGTGPLNFNGPTGIHVGPDGRVYVADNGNRRIKVFTTDGLFVREWLCSDGSVLDRPWDVAVGAGNVVYVTASNHRVLEFTDQGVFLDGWGSYGFCDGEFSLPVSVATDAAGDVYVSDFANQRIQKFTAVGGFITKWGSSVPECAPPAQEAFYPVSIATDASARVHVIARVATGNGPPNPPYEMEVQRFSNTGDPLGAWVAAGAAGGVVEPFGITVNSVGVVFVADPNSHRIRWFDADGNVLGTFGSFGPTPGRFYDPRDLAFDADGDLFVLDAGNNRVQKFTFATADVPLDGEAISLRAWPNPARGLVSVEFGLTHGGACEVGVYDLSGRRVALLDKSVRPAGNHQVRWSGLNDEGQPVSPGVYLYRVQAGEQIRTGRVAWLSPGD